MNKFLASGLLIVALVVGIGIGYLISPQYSQMNYESTQSMNLGKADKYFDQRYINAMIAHHGGAMALARQVKDITKREDIKKLAEDILANEPKAITELYQWKKDWYQDTATVNDKEVPNLGTYDDTLDQRFLNALISHHESGIEMTDEASLRSTRNDILNNADAVKTFLEGGITMLKGWRLDWYKI
jgi:hypothetical protein